jgi:hypothetical protein
VSYFVFKEVHTFFKCFISPLFPFSAKVSIFHCMYEETKLISNFSDCSCVCCWIVVCSGEHFSFIVLCCVTHYCDITFVVGIVKCMYALVHVYNHEVKEFRYTECTHKFCMTSYSDNLLVCS